MAGPGGQNQYFPPDFAPVLAISRVFRAAELTDIARPATRWGDFMQLGIVGLGRMVLSYPELPLDVLRGETLKHKRICRTFSDCTTGPRNGLPSGCYPLDHFYRDSEFGARLKMIKFQRR